MSDKSCQDLLKSSDKLELGDEHACPVWINDNTSGLVLLCTFNCLTI